jgi:hypothetical protein
MSDMHFSLASPQYIWWSTVQVSVLIPQIIALLSIVIWGIISFSLAYRYVYFPHWTLSCLRRKSSEKDALSARLERLVVQRVRRASFLSAEFQRRGRHALGALDPDAIEDLEAQVGLCSQV